MSFGRNTEWRHIVTALDGRHITTLDTFARDRTIEYELGGPIVQRGTIASDSPEINRLDLDGFPYLAEGNRLLYSLRRDYDGDPDVNPPYTPRASGIILQYDDAGDTDTANTQYTAFDPWEYLNHLPIVNPNNPDRSGDIDTKYLRTEVQLIIQSLLVNASVFYNLSFPATSAVANMFLDWGQTGEYTPAWDTLPEITHTFQKGTSIGDGIRQLIDRGHCDVIFKPIYDPAARPGYLAEVYIYEFAGEAKPEAIFAWDKPSHSVSSVSRLADGTRRTNNVRWHTWLGGGASVVTDTSDLSVERFGEYWGEQYIVSSEHTGQTSDYQEDWIDTYAEHAREVALASIPERSPEPFLEWYLGDHVRVFASPNLRATMSGFQRVSGFGIDISDDSVETVRDLRIYITNEDENPTGGDSDIPADEDSEAPVLLAITTPP